MTKFIMQVHTIMNQGILKLNHKAIPEKSVRFKIKNHHFIDLSNHILLTKRIAFIQKHFLLDMQKNWLFLETLSNLELKLM